jgi:hypothetical protein
MGRLQSERDALVERLAETEGQLDEARRNLEQAAGAGEAGGDDDEADDYRERYAMACDDVRRLRARVGELEKQLAAKGASAPAVAGPSGASLNWEAEKQRILAALDDDYDEDDEEDEAARLEIEEVVRRTDRLVAEKDREIAELKRLLEEQSGRLGPMGAGAAAVDEVLDKDEIVREEREKLRTLQREWEEMLRKAEIDISVERAKIARERSQLEERIRQLEEKGAGPDEEPEASDRTGKPTRGRWLARLGLKESDEG